MANQNKKGVDEMLNGISIQLPPELYKALKEKAESEERSMGAVVRLALKEVLA